MEVAFVILLVLTSILTLRHIHILQMENIWRMVRRWHSSSSLSSPASLALFSTLASSFSSYDEEAFERSATGKLLFLFVRLVTRRFSLF
jgi:hypothetical protein